MPPRPRTALPSPSTWRCPQCTIIRSRCFSSSAQRLAVGPEHPRYLEVPEPPQQQVPYYPPVKGVLPVPRDITRQGRGSEASVQLSTKSPDKPKVYPKGSREEWKAKMSEMRKQNLREGFSSLKARKQREESRMQAISVAKQIYRNRRLYAPEREDERLTAPSNNLDLHALYNEPVPDPTRQQRLQRKRENVEFHKQQKSEERLDALHTLYMNARDFILTPEQLDTAIDDAFGTTENPFKFGQMYGNYDTGIGGKSVWNLGKPRSVQDMLDRANKAPTSRAVEGATGTSSMKKERIRRIAEALTGGKMDEASR